MSLYFQASKRGMPLLEWGVLHLPLIVRNGEMKAIQFQTEVLF